MSAWLTPPPPPPPRPQSDRHQPAWTVSADQEGPQPHLGSQIIERISPLENREDYLLLFTIYYFTMSLVLIQVWLCSKEGVNWGKKYLVHTFS